MNAEKLCAPTHFGRNSFSKVGQTRKNTVAFLVVAGALTTSACSSVSHREGFSGSNNNQSFLMVAADGMPVTGSRSYTFAFQKVDLSSLSFLDEGTSVDFTGFGPVGGNEFEKPKQLITTIRFGGEVVSPGDYALVSRTDSVNFGTGSKAERNCFNRNAPVFHVAEHQIAIVSAGNVMTPEPLDPNHAEQQARQVIASYRNYTAPAVTANVIGRLAFDSGTSILGQPTCNPKGRFRFSGKQTVGAVHENSQ